MLREAALSNYRGHVGYLLSVDWSPVDPDVIWTGGKDFTVQEWRVSKQEFTFPPKGKNSQKQERLKEGADTNALVISGKKMADLKEKMKTKVKPKKKSKKVSGAGGAAGPEANGERAAAGRGQSSDDDEDDGSSTRLCAASPGNRAQTR